MGRGPSDGDLGNDVTSFERRLWRSARRSSFECSDPELAGVLKRVSERRLARNGSEVPVAVAARPSAASLGAAPGTVLSSERVGDTIRILRVVRPPGLDFRAGQYVKVGPPGSDRRNDYSIASAPHEPHLELCIERIPSGRLSARMTEVRPGERLALSERAKGSFVLDTSADLHVMVATTTGIAPLRSMLLDGLRDAGNRFIVLHGASYADELPYAEELTRLAGESGDRVRYEATVSRPGESRNRGWLGLTGRVDELAMRMLAAGEFSNRIVRVYACGNSGMIRSVRAAFEKAGLQVRSEAFD